MQVHALCVRIRWGHGAQAPGIEATCAAAAHTLRQAGGAQQRNLYYRNALFGWAVCVLERRFVGITLDLWMPP